LLGKYDRKPKLISVEIFNMREKEGAFEIVGKTFEKDGLIYYVNYISAEEYCKYYYSSKGYEIIKLNSNRVVPKPVSQIFEKYDLKDIKLEPGIPDFFVYKDKEYFFVECKAEGDPLQMHQLQWIMHSGYPVLIFYIQTEYEEAEVEPQDLEMSDEELLEELNG